MLLNAIQRYAQEKPEQPAVIEGEHLLTYRQLWDRSVQLAQWLCLQGSSPVLVYGHKHPNMIVSLLACLLSKRAWVPCDSSIPDARICEIKALCRSDLLLLAQPCCPAPPDGISMRKLPSLPAVLPSRCPQQIAYILYTSGTTGAPKGIPITLGNLEAFAQWLLSHPQLFHAGEQVVINQASLSFDLSVADWCAALMTGGTLVLTTREEQFQLSMFFEQIRSHRGTLLVCTPTFLRLCLCDPAFSEEALPSLRAVFLCGEPLLPSTARLAKERFPGLYLFHAYGPTEATCAVCGLEITDELLSCTSLPVGKLSDTSSQITLEQGEICLDGPSVFHGYLQQEPISMPYHTGDFGRLEGELLYCLGRQDSQIKYLGYRIDLEEVCKSLEDFPEIQQAVVTVQRSKEGIVTRLVAYTHPPCKASVMRERLSSKLPSYMIPTQWLPLSELPISDNTKMKGKSEYAAAH